ncbi:MAG: DinB family protein [Actinomycetes bacterium]
MSQELLAKYQDLSNQFIELANSFSPAELSEQGRDGGWSRAFVIHHMADADVHFSARYWHILTLDRPALANFDEELYPDRLQYSQRSATDSLAAISGLFRVNSDVLSRCTKNDWDRIGLHEAYGELTLSQILGYAVEHRESHLGQLREFA